ncbi:hypothetical protein E2C01_095945 [Portunus trituberculatus]|uniref:Uncharacterized protein n=1 Tax=Portunus trituberculatus TaxID=210409 RepID=A0A5B7JR70_PORTR|nr:hypothetical protein [Portunus trituberculatus]
MNKAIKKAKVPKRRSRTKDTRYRLQRGFVQPSVMTLTPCWAAGGACGAARQRSPDPLPVPTRGTGPH